MRCGHFLQNYKTTRPASGNASKLVQVVPHFGFPIFNVRFKTGRDYRVPLWIFLQHCATFFRKFFCRQRVPLHVFRHCETFKILIFWFFEKNFGFFYLNRVPFQFFWYFATDWIFRRNSPSFSKFNNFALFWALDIAPTLYVLVLFRNKWI